MEKSLKELLKELYELKKDNIIKKHYIYDYGNDSRINCIIVISNNERSPGIEYRIDTNNEINVSDIIEVLKLKTSSNIITIGYGLKDAEEVLMKNVTVLQEYFNELNEERYEYDEYYTLSKFKIVMNYKESCLRVSNIDPTIVNPLITTIDGSLGYTININNFSDDEVELSMIRRMNIVKANLDKMVDKNIVSDFTIYNDTHDNIIIKFQVDDDKFRFKISNKTEIDEQFDELFDSSKMKTEDIIKDFKITSKAEDFFHKTLDFLKAVGNIIDYKFNKDTGEIKIHERDCSASSYFLKDDSSLELFNNSMNKRIKELSDFVNGSIIASDKLNDNYINKVTYSEINKPKKESKMTESSKILELNLEQYDHDKYLAIKTDKMITKINKAISIINEAIALVTPEEILLNGLIIPITEEEAIIVREVEQTLVKMFLEKKYSLSIISKTSSDTPSNQKLDYKTEIIIKGISKKSTLVRGE